MDLDQVLRGGAGPERWSWARSREVDLDQVQRGVELDQRGGPGLGPERWSRSREMDLVQVQRGGAGPSPFGRQWAPLGL